jgi:hypothetical protein
LGGLDGSGYRAVMGMCEDSNESWGTVTVKQDIFCTAAMNLMLSNDFKSCRKEICIEQLLWVR